MPETMIASLLGSADASSILIGAPKSFHFLNALEQSGAISLAIAFGHLTGWNLVKACLQKSAATSVRVLLGQHFFETEPILLNELRALSKLSTSPKFEVKLASADSIFHPKVWILDRVPSSVAIVGSGNLSKGGLAGNVECGLYTEDSESIKALRTWFEEHWRDASGRDQTFEAYSARFAEFEPMRKTIRAKFDHALHEQVDAEVAWRRKDALSKAHEFWASPTGQHEIATHDQAITRMRTVLKYPALELTAASWSKFLEIEEFGKINPAHREKTIAELPALQSALRKFTADQSQVETALKEMQEITGIGRNLATKFLAMIAPGDFIVLNGPVEHALQIFHCPIEPGPDISGKGYRQFLKELAPFIEASVDLGLQPASALDTFFYAYGK